MSKQKKESGAANGSGKKSKKGIDEDPWLKDPTHEHFKEWSLAMLSQMQQMAHFPETVKAMQEELSTLYGDDILTGQTVMGRLELHRPPFATAAVTEPRLSNEQEVVTKPNGEKFLSTRTMASSSSSSDSESSSSSSSSSSDSEDDKNKMDSAESDDSSTSSDDENNSSDDDDDDAAKKTNLVESDDDDEEEDSSEETEVGLQDKSKIPTKPDASCDSEDSDDGDDGDDDDDDEEESDVNQRNPNTDAATGDESSSSDDSDNDEADTGTTLPPAEADSSSESEDSDDDDDDDEEESDSKKKKVAKVATSSSESSSSSSDSDDDDDDEDEPEATATTNASKRKLTDVEISDSESDSDDDDDNDENNEDEGEEAAQKVKEGKKSSLPPTKRGKTAPEDKSQIVTPDDSNSEDDVSDVDVSDVSSVEVSSCSSEEEEEEDESSDSSESESEDEEAAQQRARAKVEEAALRSKKAADAALNWQPSKNTPKAEVSTERGTDGAQALAKGKPFTRVDNDFWGQVAVKDGGAMANNSYEGTFGDDGFGARSSAKLATVRGKDFRHEKTKRKRSFNGFARTGGAISMQSFSTKYAYSDDEK